MPVRLDPITSVFDLVGRESACATWHTTQPLYYTPIRCADACQRGNPVMPGDHSKLEPPLPIPNRTVKRLCADDSADYPCESRSSPGSYTQNPQAPKAWGFCFGATETRKPFQNLYRRTKKRKKAGRISPLASRRTCRGWSHLSIEQIRKAQPVMLAVVLRVPEHSGYAMHLISSASKC